MPKWTVAILLLSLALSAFSPGCSRSETPALRLVGSTSVQPFAEILSQDYERRFPDRSVNVQGGGSTQGVVSAQNGMADIGTCSRWLKPEEAAELTPVLIARDGLAVIVHPSNPVANLTAEQIQGVFSGKIKNWRDLGGPSKPIWPITREEGSGTRDSFISLVMKTEKISRRAIVEDSNGSVREIVKGDPQAIGYISLGLVTPDVRAVQIDGVVPTEPNLLAGAYKFSRPFLFLTRGVPTPAAQQFIDFVMSPEGQAILAREGLVRAQ